jgi:hypothetical protein
VVAAYTNDADLRDAYRCLQVSTGAYRNLIAVDQGAWWLEGIRMCTSHSLDRDQAIQHHHSQFDSSLCPSADDAASDMAQTGYEERKRAPYHTIVNTLS